MNKWDRRELVDYIESCADRGMSKEDTVIYLFNMVCSHKPETYKEVISAAKVWGVIPENTPVNNPA